VETAQGKRADMEDQSRKCAEVQRDSRLVSVNLDLKNPNSKNDVEHRPPEELVAGILEKEHRIIEIVERIKALLEKPL